MDRGGVHDSLQSDSMVYAWVRYGDEYHNLNGRYASDLRYHFYTHRNENKYRAERNL